MYNHNMHWLWEVEFELNWIGSSTFHEYAILNSNIIVFQLLHAACGFSSSLSLVSNKMHSLRTVWVGFGSPDAVLNE